MKCKIDGCGREAKYRKDAVCQKHYFRYWRYGTYEVTRTRKYRIQNPAGYEKIFEPSHDLANSDGYVYEHRFVYFNEVNRSPVECALCKRPISWSSLHIDHIDNDVSNNAKANLRAVCRGCNVFRGHTIESMGGDLLADNGITMTAHAWSRQPGVSVTGSTIRRRKSLGYSDHDAIYAQKKTHKATQSRSEPLKHDKERGITGHKELVS